MKINCDHGADVQLDQLGDEQQGDDQARHHRARDREHQRAVDHRHAPVEQAQFPAHVAVSAPGRSSADAIPRLRARIDHAGEPADEHVEQLSDRGEHEDRRQRQLDRLRDGGDGGIGIHAASVRRGLHRRKASTEW